MSNKTKTTPLKPDGQPALTPKLRFPEFLCQTVRNVQLKDVTAESTTRNGETLPTTAVMGVSKAEGIVPMEERIISSDIARYKLVQRDWFAYNPMRLNIGSIARWQGESDILVSPDYVVFKCLDEGDSGIDPAFLDQFRRSVAWQNFVTHGGDGGVRVRIYYKDIGRLALILPTFAEQQKIAECLSSVDELISAQARKLGALKTHKQGLMQQLFPREGETQPRLRFPEFQNAGGWDSELLCELGEIVTGKTPSTKESDLWGGGILFITPTDISEDDKYQYATARTVVETKSTKILPPGSVVYTCIASIGKMALTVHPSITNQQINAVVPNEKALGEFIYYTLASLTPWIKTIPASSTLAIINKTEFSKISILHPRDKAEQQRIASCLATLDELIAAQTHKLDALKAHKKGLMQQLFPSPEEVEV